MKKIIGKADHAEIKLLLVSTLLFMIITLLPSISLLFYMAIAIILDFITGIAKARVLNMARTSAGYRKSVIKFLQYGGSIAIGLVLSNMGEGKASEPFKLMLHYFNDCLIVFIIYIEITSVFENLYAIDNKTLMSKYFISPVLKVLTWQIRNNPLVKQVDEMKQASKEGPPANQNN